MVNARGDSQPLLLDERQLASLTAAAHDLKAPLATIQYLAASLRDPSLHLTSKQQDQYIARMELSAKHGMQLVESLAFAFHAAKDQLELEPVNVMNVCDDTLQAMKPLARQLSQTIDLTYTAQAPLALAHYGALKSVVANLCDNALRHNPPESHVAMRVMMSNRGVRITVKDEGPQLRINEYRRLQSKLGKELQPLGERGGSSGLGLYIAAQLMNAMQGALRMTRHRDQGITFSLDLPPSHQLSLIG